MLIPRIATAHGVVINVAPEVAREMGADENDIADALAAQRRDAVKAECRRRIYAVASAETQLNMTSYAAAIALKPPAERTAEEAGVAAAFMAALAWVSAMRAAVAAIAGDAARDIAADASWPACPDQVVALASSF